VPLIIAPNAKKLIYV
jgi:hypothetical protein